MSDAFVEFLTENAQRSYPFAENSMLTDLGATLTLPDTVVLDFRGFHRTRPEITPCLAALVGPSAAANDDYPAVVGAWTFYFEMGPTSAPTRLAFSVPTNTANWPLSISATISDPVYAGVKLAGASVTIDQPIVGLIQDTDRFLFGASAPLEPALVAQLYRSQVDFLKIIHAEGDPEYVGGDVVLIGGYNFELIQQGSTISFLPAYGAGELGVFTGTLAPTSPCAGLLLTLNGQSPDSSAHFTLTGKNGIVVIPLPSQNKIQLKVLPATMTSPACL